MKRVYITAKVNAYQTLDILVTDEQYEELKNASNISGESFAEYIEDNFSDINYDIIEGEGLESASIYDVVEEN